MGVIHMETEQVRAVAKTLEQSARQVMDFSTQLVNQVESIPWEGQSREEFIQEIGSLLRSLRERGEFVALLATRVERHVALWESCDSSFGGAGGGVPVNPGDGGIATTAAIPEEGQFPPGFGPFPGLKPEPGGTTMALGEEGQGPGVGPFPGTGPGNPTTMAMGEEGQAIPGVDPPIGVQPEPPYLTTQAYPEEGQDPGLGPIINKPQPTTMAMGEEGQVPPGIDPFPGIKPEPGNPTTMAMGEEGQAPGFRPFPPKGNEPPEIFTMAVGEEGLSPIDPPDLHKK